MNPSGMRMEEKKLSELEVRSTHSYKSTHSSRSSVLERAREYNRRIEKQNTGSRSKSMERTGSEAGSRSSVGTPTRSQSAGRASAASSATGRLSTRERAMASVRKDVNVSSGTSGKASGQNTNTAGGTRRSGGVPSQTTDHTQPLTPASQMSGRSGQGSSHVSRPAPTTPRTPQSAAPFANANNNNNNAGANNGTNNRRRSGESNRSKQSPSRSMKNSQQPSKAEDDQPVQEGVVTPELLVDALSGHEDGLLAIAEKLMEHYDAGYDVMGEAIIDAFADVQKLFQHVVEAAHMEGAAFEASRREVEMAELRRAAAAGELRSTDPLPNSPAGTPSGPTRHDEFIDQDVKDVLNEVIRRGAALRESNKHMDCYELYEQACQSASSLLPVDSDHRGRLQLSIARAESMSADRACAILRYAMDDVLRSGLQVGQIVIMPDPSKRADVVLNRPMGHPSMSGVTGQAGVVQSADEALASLMEEMKEIMGAPVYKDTPLQQVARRFWVALNDAQKSQQKNEERLEQHLGKLKGDYLLARAEWEEQLNQTKDTAEGYKEKYERLKNTARGEDYMEQARSFNHHNHHNRGGGDARSAADGSETNMYGSRSAGRASSVASLSSGLAQQAKTIVNSMKDFNCNTANERNGSVVTSDQADGEMRYEGGRDRRPRGGGTNSGKSPYSRSSSRNKSSRSFRDYSKSPQRVDV